MVVVCAGGMCVDWDPSIVAHVCLYGMGNDELAAYALTNNVFILAIQEHNIHLDSGDPVRCFELGSGMVAASCLSICCCRYGGVGFIISPKLRRTIDSYNMVSPRSLRLQLSSDGQLKTVMWT